jgi:transcriptional regulator GlxA family with amidase domain
MARDKHKANLTPAMVATELGISVRQLHVLFERADRSFARTLNSFRTEAAHRLLVEAPALSITQIAYARAYCFLPESGFPEGAISDSTSMLGYGGQHG